MKKPFRMKTKNQMVAFLKRQQMYDETSIRQLIDQLSYSNIWSNFDKLDWVLNLDHASAGEAYIRSCSFKRARDFCAKIFGMLDLILFDFDRPQREERRRVESIKESIYNEVQYRVESDLLKKWLDQLFRENTFTSDQLEGWRWSTFEYKKTADETIIINPPCSIWTYSISGSIYIRDIKYEAQAKYRSEANRI